MALLQAPYCLRHGWVGFYLRGVLLLARAGCSPYLHCSTVILDSPLSVLMYSTSFVDETFHCRGSWANLWMSIGFRVPLISHHTPTPPIFVTCNRVVVMLAECYTGTSVVCWHGALKLSFGLHWDKGIWSAFCYHPDSINWDWNGISTNQSCARACMKPKISTSVWSNHIIRFHWIRQNTSATDTFELMAKSL